MQRKRNRRLFTEELLLHAAEGHDRQHEDADGHQHDSDAPAHAPFDDAASAPYSGLIDLVRIMAGFERLDVRQEFHADVRREHNGHYPRGQ